jgi:glycosyltransferase involved in cell wall biosynthesis
LHGPWFLNGQFEQPRTHADSARECSEGRGIQAADLVTSPSDAVLQSVRRYYQLELKTGRVIANPMEAAEEPWRIQEGRTPSLLFVGRFDRRKGADTVLHAFAQLAEANPDLRLTFVGPDQGLVCADGTLTRFDDYLKNHFKGDVRVRIDFLGKLPHAKIASLRSRCSVTIVASQYEILPYAVLEAMAHGCPIVATSVGGSPELIRNMDNGLLVPTQDASALVNACNLLLNNPDLAARLGARAWNDCHLKYTSEKLATQTIAAYREAQANFNQTRQ